MAAACALLACTGVALGEVELKLHLDFNEGTAKSVEGKHVITETVSGQPVELHNAAWAGGKFGKALVYNGKKGKEGGTYAIMRGSRKIPFLIDFYNGPFTMEVWFNPSSVMDYRQQMELLNTAGDIGPGYRLTYAWRMMRFMSGTGKRDEKKKGDYWAVATTPAKNKVLNDAWNHVAVVKDE